MRRIARFLAAVLLGAIALGGATRAGYTVYVAPHSHIDLEWYWTYEQSRPLSIRILTQALRMMKADARFTFTQDQTLALEPFWLSLNPADREFLRRMVAEGRFEIAGGMLSQPDVNASSFEALARQFVLARPWIEKTLGTEAVTGWNIDTFGQTAQMPQLFGRAGLRYLMLARGVSPAQAATLKSPFYWQSPDGTKLLSCWLPTGYGNGSRGLAESLRRLVEHDAEGNRKLLLLWGDDLVFPNEDTSRIEAHIRAAAGELKLPLDGVVFTTPRGYFREVEKSGVALVTRGDDFNPPVNLQDLRGLAASRPRVKLLNRQAENRLENAEKLSSLAFAFGAPYPEAALAGAWDKMARAQFHDAIAGSHTDQVDDILLSQYQGALEAARAAVSDAAFRLSRGIDTRRGGDYPFVVFNTLSFPRTEVVRYAPLFKEKLNSFHIVDMAGNRVPFRVLDARRWGSHKRLSMAVIEVLAERVPATGYRVYRIEPDDGPLAESVWQPADEEIANEFFTLRLNRAKGTIAEIVDRRYGRQLLATGAYDGNELSIEEETKPDLEGTLRLTRSEYRQTERPVRTMLQIRDELGVTVRIEGPFLGGRRIQEITLYHKLARIDFTTRLVGFPGHDGMLAVAFPFRRGAETRVRMETHDAVIERPDAISSASKWVDAGSSQGGVALLNAGTGGHDIVGSTVKLLLLRSFEDYEFYYAPKASEAGDHTFRYSLYPHAGNWSEAGVVEQARSFNNPLEVDPTEEHAGALPSEYSFLEAQGFEVTAVKKAEAGDALMVRGHETQGRSGRVRLKFNLAVRRAWLSDLVERPGRELTVTGSVIEFDCKPFEFVTLRLCTDRAQ